VQVKRMLEAVGVCTVRFAMCPSLYIRRPHCALQLI